MPERPSRHRVERVEHFQPLAAGPVGKLPGPVVDLVPGADPVGDEDARRLEIAHPVQRDILMHRRCGAADAMAAQKGRVIDLVPGVIRRLRQNRPKVAGQVAQRIFEQLAAETEEPALSVSVGIAVYPRDGETSRVLLETADRMLYAMKGRHHAKPLLGPQEEISSSGL